MLVSFRHSIPFHSFPFHSFVCFKGRKSSSGRGYSRQYLICIQDGAFLKPKCISLEVTTSSTFNWFLVVTENRGEWFGRSRNAGRLCNSRKPPCHLSDVTYPQRSTERNGAGWIVTKPKDLLNYIESDRSVIRGTWPNFKRRYENLENGLAIADVVDLCNYMILRKCSVEWQSTLGAFGDSLLTCFCVDVRQNEETFSQTYSSCEY